MKRVGLILFVFMSLGLPITASGDALEQTKSTSDNINLIEKSYEVSDSIPQSNNIDSEDDENTRDIVKIDIDSANRISIENTSPSQIIENQIENIASYQKSKELPDNVDIRSISSSQELSDFEDDNVIKLKYYNPNDKEGVITKSSTDTISVEIKKNYTDLHAFWNYQWDVQQVTNDGESYMLHQISKKTRVGIIDSGVLTGHPDLLNSLGNYMKNFVPKGGFNNEEDEEKGETTYVMDKMGHGTEVAGQITANGNILGVAPGVTINIYRVFGKTRSKPEWISEAIKKAADDGNQIITISSGQYLMISGSYEDGTNDFQVYLKYKEAVDYAIGKGSIIVAALGNDSLDVHDNQAMIDYLKKYRNIKIPGKIVDVPSVFENVVAVGGIDSFGNISDFSNIMVEAIYAPAGTTINLKRYGQENFINQGYFLRDWIFTTSYTGWYQYVYGNSFAAPKVAAALALITDKYDIKTPVELKNYLFTHSLELHGIKILNLVKLLNKEIKNIYCCVEAKPNSFDFRGLYLAHDRNEGSQLVEKNNRINIIEKGVTLIQNSVNQNHNVKGVIYTQRQHVLPNTGEEEETIAILGLEVLIFYLLLKLKRKV